MSDGNADYYIVRQRRLLRNFDTYVRLVRSVLLEYFGPQVDLMIPEVRAEYEQLIPQLPYIGGQRPLTQFLIFTALWLAFYRTACAHAFTLEQTGEVIYAICRTFLKLSPAFVRGLLGFMNFSPLYLWRLRRRAAESHHRRYPGDYVFDFVEGDGITFDYGVDYLECASCKFLAQQDASELAPYLCPVDILYSQALGWGLTRTTTLAEGFDRCDFRFKRGGPTRVVVPAALRKLVSEG